MAGDLYKSVKRRKRYRFLGVDNAFLIDYECFLLRFFVNRYRQISVSPERSSKHTGSHRPVRKSPVADTPSCPAAVWGGLPEADAID